MHCEYKATRKQSLHKHVQSVHDGVKYNCVQCEYKATRKQSLQQHV